MRTNPFVQLLKLPEDYVTHNKKQSAPSYYPAPEELMHVKELGSLNYIMDNGYSLVKLKELQKDSCAP